MASSSASRIVSLVLRVFSFVLLFISLIVICTNTETLVLENGDPFKARFNDIMAYRYMLATIVIGMVYFLLQIAFSIYQVVMKGEGLVLLDFYGDKFVSYLLATGAAAGYGVTKDMKDFLDAQGLGFTTFYEKANASASLVLLAFVCTAALSILSSYALPKRI